jgi:hypothetical protein
LNNESKTFLDRVDVLRIDGNFSELTKQALEAKFGGGGDALLRGFSPEVLGSPVMFADEMSALFGRGAVQFFSVITKYYESGKFKPPQRPSFAEQLLGHLGPPPEGSAAPQMVPFHDFRIKDEEGNYPDNAD